MKALVVYESMFGNTEQIAHAVANGLSDRMTVETQEVSQARSETADLLDLIVIGGPTHAFSMTRQQTREDAVRQGAHPASTTRGIREWLEYLRPDPHSELVATFDTRVDKVRHLPGSAAKKAAKVSHKLGYPAAAKPESFYVHDVSGPLLEGELDRARAWGRQLGAEAARRPRPAVAE